MSTFFAGTFTRKLTEGKIRLPKRWQRGLKSSVHIRYCPSRDCLIVAPDRRAAEGPFTL